MQAVLGSCHNVLLSVRGFKVLRLPEICLNRQHTEHKACCQAKSGAAEKLLEPDR